jgi:carboxymethylenebutenolidase
MGGRVQFPSHEHTCEGYRAGNGPAVVVIQEWWGLVPHIETVVDRFASEGFLAMAPDLYHGTTTTSPDEAKKLKMELDADRAEREIAAAGDYLLQQPECTSKKYGVVGFCMGGGLTQYTAAKERNVGAGVSFYGAFKNAPIDWTQLSAPLFLIYGEKDEGFPPALGYELEKKLKGLGKQVELRVYPGAEHAFFNDSRPHVYKPDAAADAWKRTIEFFRRHLT